jgi:hypothetical protein
MRSFFWTLASAVLLVTPAAPQIGGGVGGGESKPRAEMRSLPGLVPVAETRVLMLGINLPNFNSLNRRLAQQPQGDESWNIIQGQALLIAENGNLLMLRPPSGKEEAWLDRAADLRTVAARLARSAGEHDVARSRDDLVKLANTCNRCHKTFGVNVTITAFGGGDKQIPRPPQAPAIPPPSDPPQPPPPPRPPSGSS